MAPGACTTSRSFWSRSREETLVAYHWSIHQLTEYFDAVISESDQDAAARVAVERALEALGAEVGAVLRNGAVRTCIGLGRAAPPMAALDLAVAGSATIDVPGLGALHATAAALDVNGSGYLVIGRIDDEFSGEERQLVQGMASVLGLALRSLGVLLDERNLRTEREREAVERLSLLDTLGQRQRLLESLLAIQRLISHRAPLQSVLDAVTGGAGQLLNNAPVALVLSDPVAGRHRIASASGATDSGSEHEFLVLDTAMQSVALDDVVEQLGGGPGNTLLAAPVHIEGNTTGALVTVARTDARDVRDRRELLAAFAEQASLALTDAHTVEAMRDAFHDSLTGLPNRALFLDALAHACERAGRQHSGVTVMFLDLDRFKDVNDSFGHAAGDEFLACVAKRIRGCLRGEDTAARLGGDEFSILLERTDGSDAGLLVAARIGQAMLEPISLAGREVFASVSIGIASSSDMSMTPDTLLGNADVAMYTAKRSGSRRALVYEASMHTDTVLDLELRHDLTHAASRGQLHLLYQPLIDLATGRPVAVEALARWDHPRVGLVPPDVFIPMAERNGNIVDIGNWVLATSCEQTAAWRARGLPELTVSVNVSARQLDEAAFADVVARTLAGCGLAASALTLEITESALMRDPERTLEILAPLQALGVRLAIDDFGTGYSSLAWLQHFHADQLKIDKAFIDTMETSVEAAAIVRTVVELARTLHLETVAEGIETPAQSHLLAHLACDLGQGYLFARPLASDTVEAFFAAATPGCTSARAAVPAPPAARNLHSVSRSIAS
jgi:diguanylate cyclase (GGDEF)-like protein